MAGTLSMADLAADLKASLMLAAGAFTSADDGDFQRHLNQAALAFAKVRPRTLVGELALVADQSDYAAPNDFHSFKSSLWGSGRRWQPWESNDPGRLPDVRDVEINGARRLYLEPAPSAFQITILGAAFKFYYFANHVIASDTAQTTIKAGDRALLLLRAQAEAMRELAMRNLNKPVQMREAGSFQTRNGTPSFLYQALMEDFRREAC